nr:hypothetical protein [Tanacetum cinerariifolium]
AIFAHPYQKKTTNTLVSNAFFALEEDNGKPMNDLVANTRKKVKPRSRKRTLLRET